MKNEMLDAALEYAAMGWAVFPLKPRSKEPATAHGFKDATTDAAQVAEWWAERPGCNIGVSLGAPSGNVFAIDIDVDEGGDYDGWDALREWERENGELPETASTITGKGGSHILYRASGEVRPSANNLTHIDIRGDGSYIVAPPSIHPNGQRYEWENHPDDTGITAANAQVMAFVDKMRPNGGEDTRPKVTAEGKLSKGGRNNMLFKMACGLQAQSWDDDAITASVEVFNSMKCKPPLPDYEVGKILESALKLPKGKSAEWYEEHRKDGEDTAKRGRPRKFEHNKVAQTLIDEYGACLIDGETPAIRQGGRYVLGWDAFDSAIIGMHDDCTVSNRKEVKAYIQVRATARKQSSPYLIAFTNGVLDVRTMELRDWTPDDVIPNVIPHRWNPDAKGEALDAVLDKMACGDVATCLNLAEFIGVCMVRSAKLCPFFPVLIGIGSNGKSTYIELLKNVVGDENISGLQPKEIAAHFLASHIVGKTANLGDDISSGYLDDRDCAVIKSVATGDLMFTDVKGGKGFHFQPYCTMVFSCNQFPRLADTTPGFMRRLFPVEFNAVFSPDDPDFDPMIGEKLAQEESLEHACVIGVEGLRRVLAQHRPTPNSMSESMRSEIARDGNTGLQWFNDDEITADSLVGMTKEEAYRKYLDWCERNGYSRTAMGSGTLSALIGTYFRLKCTKTGHRDVLGTRKTVRVYAPKVP